MQVSVCNNSTLGFEGNGWKGQLKRESLYWKIVSRQQSNGYSYDYNGNLTSHANKGYTSIVYNYLNLIKQVGITSEYILCDCCFVF